MAIPLALNPYALTVGWGLRNILIFGTSPNVLEMINLSNIPVIVFGILITEFITFIKIINFINQNR